MLLALSIWVGIILAFFAATMLMGNWQAHHSHSEHKNKTTRKTIRFAHHHHKKAA